MTAERKKGADCGVISVYMEGNESVIHGEVPLYCAQDIIGVETCEEDAGETLVQLSGKKACALRLDGHSTDNASQILFFRSIYRALGSGRCRNPIVAVIGGVVLPSELERVRKNASDARNGLTECGIPCGRLTAGVGIETPSSAILSDLLAPMSDFFVFDREAVLSALDCRCSGAASRSHEEVADRCLKLTASAAKREGIAVCRSVRRAVGK